MEKEILLTLLFYILISTKIAHLKSNFSTIPNSEF